MGNKLHLLGAYYLAKYSSPVRFHEEVRKTKYILRSRMPQGWTSLPHVGIVLGCNHPPA